MIAAIKRDAPGLMVASRVNVYDGPRYDGRPGGPGRGTPEPENAGFGVSAADGVSPDLAEPLRLVGLLADWACRWST